MPVLPPTAATGGSAGFGGPAGSGKEPRVLLVEDDDTIRESVSAALSGAWFAVTALPDGRGLEEVLDRLHPAVVILDWMLPGRDGPQLVRAVASRDTAGVIMLTARDAVADRLRGFEQGVDDYLVKPFVMAELIARVRALMHRLGAMPSALEIGDLVVDESRGVATRGGHDLGLTATELKLLALLATDRGRVLSSTQILSQVWGYEAYSDNLVHVHLSALRRKMERYGPRMVHTVRGLGYVLKPAE